MQSSVFICPHDGYCLRACFFKMSQPSTFTLIRVYKIIDSARNSNVTFLPTNRSLKRFREPYWKSLICCQRYFGVTIANRHEHFLEWAVFTLTTGKNRYLVRFREERKLNLWEWNRLKFLVKSGGFADLVRLFRLIWRCIFHDLMVGDICEVYCEDHGSLHASLFYFQSVILSWRPFAWKVKYARWKVISYTTWLFPRAVVTDNAVAWYLLLFSSQPSKIEVVLEGCANRNECNH